MRCDDILIILIMAIWSWSTLQFTLVLTASQARRTRAVGVYDNEDGNSIDVDGLEVGHVEEIEEDGNYFYHILLYQSN